MPLPLIPVAVAMLASSAFGIKKGANAVSANREANELMEDARRRLEEAQDRLERERRRTASELEELGRCRIDLWQRPLGRFVTLFRLLKNTHLIGEAACDGSAASFDPQSLPELEHQVSAARSAATSVAAGAVSGMAIGAGAAFGTASLAAASTGTAIAGLSGAAATNATLAWLGGGSLAAGGFGMAGGMVVLGGLVTAPVLAVGGFFMNKAMQAKLDEARSKRAEALRVVAEMVNAYLALDGIREVCARFRSALSMLDQRLSSLLDGMESLMRSRGVDLATWTVGDRRYLRVVTETVHYLKTMLQAPVLDEEGRLHPALSNVIDGAIQAEARAISATAS
ncbi:MAG: hypothetical protein R3A52_24545 [Polyangiales bacterium]